MTDIVEWLRTTPRRQGMDFDFVGRLNEAADAIEHLREMLESLMAPGGAARIGPSFTEITKGVRRDLGYRSDASGVPVITRERALPGFDKPEPEMPRRRLEELSEKPIG